jgi:large subunit ribosomal protein L24
VSNVMVVDPETNRPTRVGYRRDSEGRKVRVSKRTGKDL